MFRYATIMLFAAVFTATPIIAAPKAATTPAPAVKAAAKKKPRMLPGCAGPPVPVLLRAPVLRCWRTTPPAPAWSASIPIA
ncbi:MAG: hypothetical protein QGH94_10850, partial [Phycisphaerae bacterium]|nr:hypothetical protein [Phycisphaerae bacterium]